MMSFGRVSWASRCDLVHVDEVRVRADLVGRDVVELARHVELHPVREVAAVREREAHDAVARLEQRVEDLRVGLRAGVRLDVRVLGAEQLLGAVDRELLDDVDVLAAAVVALARIALGVLVRQHAALALQDRLRDEVLRGDHLQRALLAIELEADGLGDLRVDLGERAVEEVRRQIGHSGDGSTPRGAAVRRVRGRRSGPRGGRGGRPRGRSPGSARRCRRPPPGRAGRRTASRR